MRVLVTGGAGYIGSVLTRMLLEQGFDVTVLDRFFFGHESLKEIEDRIKIVKDDIRWFDPKALEGVDAVMDLAALSNDPVGELDPQKTMEINYKGRVRVANLAKKYKVSRYILASSCSVYGFREDIVTEQTPPNPLTTYAKACVAWENEVLPLADKDFSVTSLRQSSVYGFSKRMRFDLAVNNMALGFFKNKKIPIMREGTQQRPFIHIKDTSRGFIAALTADKEKVNKQIFNLGSNDGNFKIFDLAKAVAESIGVEFAYDWYGQPDFRSYSVSFDKVREALGYKAQYTPRDGAKEIYGNLQDGTLKEDERMITVKWYKRLMDMQAILKDVEIDNKIL
jgi:nucleoside-diphosphate-sugar epimerase